MFVSGLNNCVAGVHEKAKLMIDVRVNLHFLLGSWPLVEYCLREDQFQIDSNQGLHDNILVSIR